MKKVVVKILQGSVVTETKLGGLTIHPPVANFLECICAKIYENWMTVDKVIAKIIWLTFFWPTLYLNAPSINQSINYAAGDSLKKRIAGADTVCD